MSQGTSTTQKAPQKSATGTTATSKKSKGFTDEDKAGKGKPASAPGFVVLYQMPNGHWRMLGEVLRKRGLTARAARSRAILDATKGAARAGEVYAAILRSEWRLALDWTPPKEQ